MTLSRRHASAAVAGIRQHRVDKRDSQKLTTASYMKDTKQDRLKTGAKIALTILLVNVVAQLAAVYQTRYQLNSPLIPESTIWKINKQFIFNATLTAAAGVIGLLLYFFDKYLLVIILAVSIFIAGRFIYV